MRRRKSSGCVPEDSAARYGWNGSAGRIRQVLRQDRAHAVIGDGDPQSVLFELHRDINMAGSG